MKNLYKIENEVYIVSNTENVNENCWIIVDDRLVQVSYLLSDEVARGNKVILTTNKLLIKDGVQAIDDEFLEWFVKNPSCERVEVDKTIPYNFDGLDSVRQDKFLELFYKSELFDEIKYNDVFDWSVNEGKDYLKLFQSYKIIIPKEEPKQETLEEANWKVLGTNKDTFYNGAKWQEQRMYSEEEVLKLLLTLPQFNGIYKDQLINQWFEQFKKI